MLSRRGLLGAGAVLGAGAFAARAEGLNIPEAPTTTANGTQPPLVPSCGPDYQPVVTLNGWTLPWRMNGGIDIVEFGGLDQSVEGRRAAPAFAPTRCTAGGTSSRELGRKWAEIIMTTSVTTPIAG